MAIKSFCFEQSRAVNHQLKFEIEKYITGEYNIKLSRINDPHESDASVEYFLYESEFNEFYEMMTCLKDLPSKAY